MRMSEPRSTATRNQHRRQIARSKPDCAICLKPIDYTLPHTDPMSFVVDHIKPWVTSQDDSLDNKQAAHRSCNRAKSDKLDHVHDPGEPRVFTTWRTW